MKIRIHYCHAFIFILIVLLTGIILVLHVEEKNNDDNIIQHAETMKTGDTATTGTCGIMTVYYEDGTREVYTPTLGTIVIDPGHGGVDPGKVGINGALEKDINLQIALLLKPMLEAQGYEVIMTREVDEDICTGDYGKIEDLENRIDIIRDAEAMFVVSIHQNSYSDSNVSGAQVFYPENSEEGLRLAQCIQESMHSLDENNKRTIRSNNDYYLFLHSATPIVIVECGFLSNPDEEGLLMNTDYQLDVAESIFNGIHEFLLTK